jgi:SPP1 family predicted phage head-tail adaptor
MSTTANDLRERVTIQNRPTITRDSYNAETGDWADVVTVWAKVTAGQGSEAILADRPVMIVPTTVEIRNSVAVTTANRLLWRGKVLAVEAVMPQYAAGMLVIRCLEATY